MSPCPSRELLQEMLGNKLDEPAFAEIETHIQACRRCQDELEVLTSDHGGKSTVREIMADRGPSGEPTAVFSAIKEADQTVDRLGVAANESATDEPDSGGGSTNALAGDIESDDSLETMTASGSPGDSPHSASGIDCTEWPRLPGYEIVGRLGEGGMGVVFKARQIGLNRMVALKMIRGGTHARPDHLIRFSIEAEAVARLQHQNIIQIFDIGSVEGSPYVSLELLEGGSLADRLKGTPQPGRPAAELLETLVLAIVAAHQAGIIHRDLKPSNVLFTAEGVLKVTDFGLAKRLESDDMHTETGQVMGSPSYMAPEQARGHSRDIGPAADVYALGAILYEMLTGRPPFSGESAIETIRQVIDDIPVPPSRLVPRVPRDLETMSLKCLNKEPHKRYESAQALADDLRRYIRQEPIKARPTPFWERGARWARRRPAKAISLFLGTAISLAAIASFIGYERFNAQQDFVARQTNADAIFEAQAQMGRDLMGARSSLLVVLSRIAARPAKQQDLAVRARRLLIQVDERLAEQSLRDSDRKRFDDFFRARQLAFTHDTEFTGLELSSSRQATRRAARAALDIFSTPRATDSWALPPLPESFSADEKNRIKESCYELLLILAEAVDQPAESLRLLDHAAQLRAPDKTFHLRRSSYLARTGDASGAEREQRAADAAPLSTPVDHFLTGRDQFKRREFASAARHFDFTLLRQPDHFWARCLSALCELQLGQHQLAKERLTACIERESDNPWLYVWRGLASMQLAGRARDATRPPQEAKAATEESEHQFQAAQLDYDRVLELLKQTPDNLLHWVLLVNRGNLFVQHADWEKASADFLAATRLDAKRIDSFVGLAIVYQRQGKPDEAIEQFSRAIALQRGSAALYRARAEVELSRNDPTVDQRARALADLDQAIRLESPANPVLALDHIRRAKLLHLAHGLPDALSACEAALKVDRDHKDAHLVRIQVLMDLKRYDEVTRSCDALLEKDKTSAAIFELRGLARASLKNFSGAIEDDTQAIAIEPGRALLYLRRGGLYLVSDAPKLALHDFDVAFRLDSSNSDALAGRAAALARLGQHREAVADAERALASGATTAQRLYAAARTYARAAAVAATSGRTKGRDSLSLVEQYQDRGAALLREAVKKLPAGERAAFWRDVVQGDPDPAMNALRRRLRSGELDSQARFSTGAPSDQP